jgi:predicted rRNA methylase YqxC with S4 and FtsJ domains
MAVSSKQRADQLLVELGLADSRTRAQALIMAAALAALVREELESEARA